jgi:hypothetical protein
LELNLQLVEVPLALLPKAIDSEAQDALLLLAQIFDPDTRRTAKAEKPRRLDPYGAVEDKVVLADQDRGAEAERADRIGDLAYIGGSSLRTSRAGMPRSSRRTYTRSSGGSRSLRGARAGGQALRPSRRRRLLPFRPPVSERAA